MNRKQVTIEALMPIISEQLLDGKQPIIPIKGTSMRPFYLSGRTFVELAKPHDLKKKDAVLYLNNHGNYILHRIIKIKEDTLVIRGDALKKKEYVKKENVIAKITRHQHNKAWVEETARTFRIKLTLWQLLSPVRRPLLKLERRLRRRLYDQGT